MEVYEKPRVTELVLNLHEKEVVQIDTEKGFKIKHHDKNEGALLSPVYLRIRTPDHPTNPGPVTPDLLRKIGEALWEHTNQGRSIKFDAVAGLPHAGTPLAQAFVEAAKRDNKTIPLIKLGKVATEAGRKVEGIEDDGGAPRGCRVLVIDDLITYGDTKDEGINELRMHGYAVTDVLVIVDREQGGSVHLRKQHISLCYLFTLRTMVETLAEHKKISPTVAKAIHTYLDSCV